MNAQDIINLLEGDIEVKLMSKIRNLDQTESDNLFNEIDSRMRSFSTPSLLNIDTVEFMNLKLKDKTDFKSRVYNHAFFQPAISYLRFCQNLGIYNNKSMSELTELIIKESLQFKSDYDGYYPLFLYNAQNVIDLILLLDILYIQNKTLIQEIYPFMPGLIDINKVNSIFFQNNYLCHHGDVDIINNNEYLGLVISYFLGDFVNFDFHFRNGINYQNDFECLLHLITSGPLMRESSLFKYTVEKVQDYINKNPLTATQLLLVYQNNDIFYVDFKEKLNMKNEANSEDAYGIKAFLYNESDDLIKKILLSSGNEFKFDVSKRYISDLYFNNTDESDLFYLTLISKGNQYSCVSYECFIDKLSETVRNSFNTYRESSLVFNNRMSLDNIAKLFIKEYNKPFSLTDISFEDED